VRQRAAFASLALVECVVLCAGPGSPVFTMTKSMPFSINSAMCRKSCYQSSGHLSGYAPPSLKNGESIPRLTLTAAADKPSIVTEQATSSYSFRSSELSQPI